MKNLIGIDSSENSTAITVKSNKGFYLFNYTTKEENYKWIKLTNNIIKYNFFKYEKFEEYSKNEISKLKTFSTISNSILNDILNSIDKNEKCIIKMEGYNYGKGPGKLIDLVGIGQSIRMKLYENIPNIEIFEILSPMTLKVKICDTIYGKPKPLLNKKNGKELKKKLPSINKYGIKGSEFEKKDIYIAIMDGEIDSPIYNFYKENNEIIMKNKDLPKPFDDINDSLMLILIQ